MKAMIDARAAVPAVRNWGLSWPLIVCISTIALIACQPGLLLRDADTYWHLAAGRWMLEHASIPTLDAFSHSMPGAPWTAFEWLSELVMVGVYRLGGWVGLVALAACCFGLVLALLMRFLLARMEPVHALLFTVLAGSMLLTHLLARPHVMAWLLLALWISALVGAAESRRSPPWWLLGLMVLWANMHGSFILGLLLGAGVALDAVLAHPRGMRRAAAKPWGLFVALSVGAGMVTPNGWQVLWHAVYIMGMKALSHIGEWRSPNFLEPSAFELWLLLVLALAFSGRVRLPWLRLVLVLGLVHMALKHQRNVAVLGLVAPFLMATPFARHWYATATPNRDAQALDRWFLSLAAPARPMAIAACACATALFAAASMHLRPPMPAPSITPRAAVEAAMAAGAKGRLLNEYSFGGFLIYEGIPVFIDGRADMYGDAFFQKFVDAVQVKERKQFIAFLDEHGFGWTLLAPGTSAIAVLDDLPGWRRVYADDTAVVHVHVGAASD
ncbi:hypothetical protein [Variovorax soli]|uniref:4-amino-4-deoxy-L-arabinose transferase n=1 Tax=Variovorax soli TaxID=376815 RepID=A0ABU1NM16_9BURK|nr:hypothetical protein [Variovorax soli]MDR6539070.1 hypothetical protein [Variovorax soli]